MTFSVQTPIQNGPCKFDLMVSLFEGKQVTLRAGGQDYQVVFTKLMLEDGSRMRWIFSAYIVTEDPWKNITGYYDVKGRRGYISAE